MTGPVFANSAFVSAPERLVLRAAPLRPADLWVRYGLWLGKASGPVLIDTGYTRHATSGQGGAALRLYSRVLAPRLNAEAQPEAFLAAHGLRPADVATVIVTHFHADHVSGLALFPKARFLASAGAFAAIRRRRAMGNLRHGVFAELLPSDFAERLDAVEARPMAQATPLIGDTLSRDLFGDGSVLAVDLPGHAEGHFGLVFPHGDRPLFYAVDAQWRLAALDQQRRPGFPSSLVADDRVALGRSTDLVRRFADAGGRVLLCHDPALSPHDWPGQGHHVPHP